MQQPATPEVSVITAFYNEELFLSEAIQSVLKQTYTNWEMVLVDDGSSDGSTQIAKHYAEAYPGKILYTEHEGHANKSTAASRNLGISKARGSLVAFLDADDVWEPAKLLNQVNIMHDQPKAAMLLEASKYWNSWHNTAKQDIVVQVGQKRDQLFEPPKLAEMLYPLVPVAAPCPSAIMIRREILVKHGGFESTFTGKYQLYEDQAFLVKFYLNEPIYISSACNNKYRQRIGSCVQWVRNEGSYHVVRKYFLNWLALYMERNNIKHSNVQRLFHRAQEQYNRPVIYFFRKSVSKFQKAILKRI